MTLTFDLLPQNKWFRRTDVEHFCVKFASVFEISWGKTDRQTNKQTNNINTSENPNHATISSTWVNNHSPRLMFTITAHSGTFLIDDGPGCFRVTVCISVVCYSSSWVESGVLCSAWSPPHVTDWRLYPPPDCRLSQWFDHQHRSQLQRTRTTRSASRPRVPRPTRNRNYTHSQLFPQISFPFIPVPPQKNCFHSQAISLIRISEYQLGSATTINVPTNPIDNKIEFIPVKCVQASAPERSCKWVQFLLLELQ